MKKKSRFANFFIHVILFLVSLYFMSYYVFNVYMCACSGADDPHCVMFLGWPTCKVDVPNIVLALIGAALFLLTILSILFQIAYAGSKKKWAEKKEKELKMQNEECRINYEL